VPLRNPSNALFSALESVVSNNQFFEEITISGNLDDCIANTTCPNEQNSH
jgi:hypothetical protein